MSTSRRSPKAGEPLGREAWAAICAVEGLALSEEGRRRVEADKPLADRRSDVLRAYRAICEDDGASDAPHNTLLSKEGQMAKKKKPNPFAAVNAGKPIKGKKGGMKKTK